MNGVMVAMLVVVGVLAGVLAGYVMKRGGYGLRWDASSGWSAASREVGSSGP
jgi:uncharacterized membrane protein YeaQ/YmgE (transglycosylase-associated protein family)